MDIQFVRRRASQPMVWCLSTSCAGDEACEVSIFHPGILHGFDTYTLYRYTFYLDEVIDVRNDITERELERAGRNPTYLPLEYLLTPPVRAAPVNYSC